MNVTEDVILTATSIGNYLYLTTKARGENHPTHIKLNKKDLLSWLEISENQAGQCTILTKKEVKQVDIFVLYITLGFAFLSAFFSFYIILKGWLI